MSNTETPAAPGAAPTKRRGWRRFFVGSALVLAGVIVGIGTTAFSQGDGPRGGFGDGPGRHWGENHDGPRGMRGWSRDDDGPRGMRGWFNRDDDRDGPRGWGGWGRGGMHGWHGRGGGFLTPGRIERMVDRLAWAVDASSDQKQKLAAIAQRTADDLRSARERHLDLRKQARDVLAAPTVDRGKLEALRAELLKLGDDASRRITSALGDAAEVLTPEQRADLGRRLERWSSWRRG